MTGPRVGSLFSGYGGLDEGVRAVLGGTVVWHSEVDPGACKILAHRYPDVPNLGDITQVDWAAVEPVDVLTGGSPCQDVSAAGKRLGMRAGTRSGLWASMCDAIDIIRPSLVMWENVRGVLSAGADSAVEPCPICVGDERDSHLRALGRVVGDLAELGYVGRWTGLRAADVGAPHGRFRVFLAAWPAGDAAHLLGEGCRRSVVGDGRNGATAGGSDRCPDATASAADSNGGPVRQQPVALSGRRRTAVAGLPGADAAPHSPGDGRHEGRPESAGLVGGSDAALGGDAAADTDGDRREGLEGAPSGRDAVRLDEWDHAHGRSRGAAHPHAAGIGRRPSGRDDGVRAEGLVAVDWGAYGEAIRRWERCLGRPAPAPTELSAKNSPRLSPRFVEFLMGLPAGWVTDVPGLTRNEQLKALGNGVVPQQAAHALRLLLADVPTALEDVAS